MSEAQTPAPERATGDDVLPLAGVRVLEFGHTIMGPSAAVILADLGADVIKVEPAPLGDTTRRMRGFASGFFYAFNRNKRSIAVDIKAEAGRDIVHRLAETADVVIENYGPGTMERLGCGYGDLSKVNPRIIFCSLKGFLSGPYEHRPALDEVVQFMAGMAFMTGPPGHPLRAGASVIDIMGGMFGVISIQAALAERERTGKGQFIKSALFETTAFLMTQHMAGEAITGEASVPMSVKNESASAWAIYEPFETADGESIFIGLTSDNHWRRFWEHFGRQDMIDNPDYQTNPDRVSKRSETVPIVTDVVRGETLATMVELCDRIGIPFAPVARPGDLFDDPQLTARGRALGIEFPNGKTSNIPPLPVEIGTHKFGVRMQTPAVGAHSRELLAELGFAEAEIDDLAAREVVVVAD